jgi:hypothetical protein
MSRPHLDRCWSDQERPLRKTSKNCFSKWPFLVRSTQVLTWMMV